MSSTNPKIWTELKMPPRAAAPTVMTIWITVMTSNVDELGQERLPIPAISYWNATRSGVETTRSSEEFGGCTPAV